MEMSEYLKLVERRWRRMFIVQRSIFFKGPPVLKLGFRSRGDGNRSALAAINVLVLRSFFQDAGESPALSNDLTSLSARELARLIRVRTVSPVEVVEAHLRRIDQINPSLNAIVTLADDAIDQARDAEARLSRGNEAGPLYGLPVTIKDTIDVKGLRMTSGSCLLANNVPDHDATAVARLKSAGAIILGKTN